MPIFENITKKATEVGAKAIEVTKGLSDTTLLKSTVSTEEKNIQSAYYQIGKLYYSTHQQDYEPAFEELVKSIQYSQKKIKKCKDQIQKINNLHTCEKCGADVPNNAYYCGKCGAPNSFLQKCNQTSETVTCSQCGGIITKGTKFCTICGNKIS